MVRTVLAFLLAMTLAHPASASTLARGRALEGPRAPARSSTHDRSRTPDRIKSDFNGDGYEDLAISVFGETVNGLLLAGAVEVIYGSPNGLNAANNQVWTEDKVPDCGGLQYQAMFGRSLAVGDFNHDGYSDLVIGIMHEDLQGVGKDAGEVAVLYGSSTGLTATGSQCWTESDLSSSIGSQGQALFGRSLDGGDFNGDGYDDLAIGIGYQNFDNAPNAGAAGILYGSAAGLTATGNQYFTEDTPGMLGDGSESFNRMGWSVSAADFNHDGYDDLAIGIPGDDVLGIAQAGSVAVVYGSAAGLTVTGNQLWSEDLLSSTNGPQAGDFFGRNVRAGNFNGDSYADLAIGIPSEDVDGFRNAGAVAVIYGSANGLDANAGPGNQTWNEDSSGIIGTQAQTNDRFGRHEGVGDFNGDGNDDLAVGIVGKKVNGNTSAGAVLVIYGSAAGLTSTGNQFWTQDSPGVKGVAEPFDAMGRAVTGLDFNQDGYDDLAIGSPGDIVAGLEAAGAVNVLYGSAAGATATNNQRWTGSSTGILIGAQAGALFGSGFPGQTAGGCGQGGTCQD